MSGNGGVGSWRKDREIGRGAFGKVFLGYRKEPNAPDSIMAVKTEPLSSTCSLERERRFLDQFCGCSNVVQCLGSEIGMSRDGSAVYNLFLEYADGGSLCDHIGLSHGSGLTEPEVKHYTRCILQGIAKVHELGFVHCDLKPENILMFIDTSDTNFSAKIADLGLLKRSDYELSRRGTAAYMAPETVIYEIQEPPSDIWALGLIVLEMITGVRAWVGVYSHIDQVFDHLASDNPTPFVPSGLSKEAHSFLNCCFDADPFHRLTAVELLQHPFLVSRPCAIEGAGQNNHELGDSAVDVISISGDSFILIGSSSYSSQSYPSHHISDPERIPKLCPDFYIKPLILLHNC